MPELVEVECWRLVLEQYCQGLRIKHCEFADDAIVLGHADPRELVQGVSGHSVMSLSRKGKHLWMNLENKKMLCFHFGMTGQFFVRKKEGEDHQIHGKIQLKSNIRHSTEMQWPPKYWKCRLVMEDGTEAVFLNVRRLGRIRLLSQVRFNSTERFSIL